MEMAVDKAISWEKHNEKKIIRKNTNLTAPPKALAMLICEHLEVCMTSC